MKQILDSACNFPFIKKSKAMDFLTWKFKVVWAVAILFSTTSLLSFAALSKNTSAAEGNFDFFQFFMGNPQSHDINLLFYNMEFDYDKAWKEILKLETEGLPKSALEKTIELLENARKEGKHDHLIKALIYKGKYESQLEEDGLVNAIYKMQQELEHSEFPVKPILQSMLAEMYIKYLDQNRWQFQNRTQTVEFKNEDIRTWAMEQLTKESSKYYWASLADKELKSSSIDDFKILLEEGRNDVGLRPTLYDFLAHRAIDHFVNERNYLTQPAYKFEIADEKAFAPVTGFIKWQISTKDTSSQKYQTLLLFQDLLRFRSSEKRLQSPSLLDADLKRLRFVYSNSINKTKDSLYLAALENLSHIYIGSASVAEINYAIAQHYHNKGKGYQPPAFGKPDLDDRKSLWKNAHDIAQQVIKEFPNSVAASKCRSLLNQILGKEMRMQAEMVNLPNQPFLTKLTYRNLEKVNFKVIPFTQSDRKKFEQLRSELSWQEKSVAFFNKRKASESWSVNLPNDGDFHRHSVEIKVNPQRLGLYAIVISENEDFESGKGTVGYLFAHVSNLGYWERKDNGTGSEFVIFDRKSGIPIKGATVEFWTQTYNSIFRKYEKKKSDTQVSDIDGFVKRNIERREDRNFNILIKKDNDELIIDKTFYNDYYSNDPQPYQQTQFFLDRSIYRPGQTVYFKGIALSFDEKRMPTILKNKNVTVTFKDANYQEVSKLELRSNEYGTFNGQFVAPRGGLLGNMQLVSSIGGNVKSFRVEEYKRPKFEVEFDPIKESYRLNDQVKVTGKATAYAGNQIDGAEVIWRAVRQTRFPWYRWRWGRMPWNGETMEISNGTAKTDENGQFKIEFPALPDRKIPAKNKPEFSYTIYADVTDITGETRSRQTYVKVGYIALQVDIPIAAQANVNSLKKLDLVTKNLNGEFEPAKGTIKIELLESNGQIYVDRFWEAADRRSMPESEFKKDFPQFAWNRENEPQTWKVERTVLDQKFDTEKSTEVILPKSKLNPGWYAVTLNTEDKYGEKVELKKHFSLFDLSSKNLPSPALLWHYLENKPYQPGVVAESYFGSSRKQQPVLLEYEKDGKTLDRKWLTVKDVQSNNYLVKESDRGNVSYLFSYAGLNRSFNHTQTIVVPWSNKELTIEYGTFRDKLLPGQEEEWTVKIKGPKGEKVAAEMVAGMYDASLDAFARNDWGLNVFPSNWTRVRYNGGTFMATNQRNIFQHQAPIIGGNNLWLEYDKLNWFNWHFDSYQGALSEVSVTALKSTRSYDMSAPAESLEIRGSRQKADNYFVDGVKVEGRMIPKQESDNSVIDLESDPAPVQIRTNLNETVFFFPQLMTDAEGNILIKFKMNEALTKWRFLGLAHTEDLKVGITQKEIVTQKEMMVVPNPPRFFRENDEIEFTAKVVNLTDKSLSGNAELQLVNPMNSMPVFKWLDNPQFNQNFTVAANQSARLAWRFKIPDVADVPVIEHTVVAVAGEYSDGERSAAPVLSNRMLVTETKPLPVRGHETKGFVFESLKKNNSSTLRHQGLTLEFTQNPAWYAVQALPYLMEYPYECTEQVFSRYYANSLATSVSNSHPKIKSVFDKWRDYEPDALLSNLSKNQKLKTALLEETPWVLNAQSEEQQKQNIGLLFDLNRMAYEQEASLKKLQDRQMPGGGWAWFPGGRDSWYITQYLVEGLGHLQKLNVDDIQENPATWQMVQKAVKYCDDRMVEQYEELERLVKEGKTSWESDHLNYMAAHFLYTRSFFLENKSAQASTGTIGDDERQLISLQGKVKQVHDYYLGQAEKYWLKKNIYTEGMLSLAMFRNGNVEAARKVIRSLKEHSLYHEELGMYWKYPVGWWWYQAPIETHSLMIEAFSDIADDPKAVEDLKVWLLKNKQTTHWKTTKATANAVYALLSNGDKLPAGEAGWLLDNQPLSISFVGANATATDQWNNELARAQSHAEAGTGYFKSHFDGEEVSSEMGEIQITNPNNVVAWGAMYWQYFEQLDKITTFEETPLTIKKQLFRVENSDRGEIIRPVEEDDVLKVGEKLKVRIVLRVDRDMEYVHMKDMRASGFEPMNVLSQYKWQGGLGYYESTRDAATNFFFSWLPKGTHVFEYPLRVQLNGYFSNGITTVQCMYAPEFTSHSEGVRVKVGE